jgi:hypothetical protein
VNIQAAFIASRIFRHGKHGHRRGPQTPPVVSLEEWPNPARGGVHLVEGAAAGSTVEI